MNFVSLQYGFFLALVVTLYWHLNHKKQLVLLFIASYTFYGLWDWRFLALLFGISCVDFVAGNAIFLAHSHQKPGKARGWLCFSLTTNLIVLGYFKYAGFFVDSFIQTLHFIGFDFQMGSLSIILPVGISFYVFQSISHSIDVYRQTLTPSKNLLEFLTFVSFFPQLVAGPIVRAQEFLHQLTQTRRFHMSHLENGFQRILTGLVKKAVIADNLALYLVDPVFAAPDHYASPALWLAIVAYAIQIYCDFSGYSNIAIGSAQLFGFHLPENFRFPYLAKNFSDFWERWHLTMSRFFRDYVYIPLGGNRRSSRRNTFNLVTTTFVSGLWHGAAWHFVIWGLLHGFLLIIQRQVPAFLRRVIPPLFGYFSVMFGILITWIFFRAPDMGFAFKYCRQLFSLQTGAFEIPLVTYPCFALFVIDHTYGAFQRQFDQYLSFGYNSAIFWSLCCFIIFHGTPQAAAPFIYFQF